MRGPRNQGKDWVRPVSVPNLTCQCLGERPRECPIPEHVREARRRRGKGLRTYPHSWETVEADLPEGVDR